MCPAQRSTNQFMKSINVSSVTCCRGVEISIMAVQPIPEMHKVDRMGEADIQGYRLYFAHKAQKWGKSVFRAGVGGSNSSRKWRSLIQNWSSKNGALLSPENILYASATARWVHTDVQICEAIQLRFCTDSQSLI